MPGNNIEEVKERLVAIDRQFVELIDLIINDATNSSDIKNKYGVLKVKLRSGRDKINLTKTQDTASESELCYYYPAVSEAANALSVPISGRVTSTLIDTLHDAHEHIQHYLNQLENV